MGGGIGVGGLNKIEWHKVADSFSCIIGKKSKHLYDKESDQWHVSVPK